MYFYGLLVSRKLHGGQLQPFPVQHPLCQIKLKTSRFISSVIKCHFQHLLLKGFALTAAPSVPHVATEKVGHRKLLVKMYLHRETERQRHSETVLMIFFFCYDVPLWRVFSVISHN